MPFSKITAAPSRKPIAVGWALFVVSLVVGMLGLCAGNTWISPIEVINTFYRWATVEVPSPTAEALVLTFRAPRVVLGLIVGGGLAVAGAGIQTAVRNPLADPYILGVSSGAALGAVTLLYFVPGEFGGMLLFLAAWAGAAAATAVSYFLARQRDVISPHRLILAGVACTYLLNATTSFVLVHVDRNGFGTSSAFLYWSLGSLAQAKWDSLVIPGLSVVLGTLWLATHWRSLDCMNLGDERSTTLGVRPNALRLRLFFVSSTLVGACVGCSGPIGFVGLMVPHAMRMIVGNSHKHLLICSALAGAVFLSLADLAGRVIGGSQEFAVGILAAMFGAPFFLYLLRRSRP